jgi:hypothetical protein
MHRSPSRLVALVVFALFGLLSFVGPSSPEWPSDGYCVDAEDSSGPYAYVCTPWD